MKGLEDDDRPFIGRRALERERAEITLHVGYGTFKPVRSETVEEHEVDPERYEIPPAAAEAIAAALCRAQPSMAPL